MTIILLKMNYVLIVQASQNYISLNIRPILLSSSLFMEMAGWGANPYQPSLWVQGRQAGDRSSKTMLLRMALLSLSVPAFPELCASPHSLSALMVAMASRCCQSLGTSLLLGVSLKTVLTSV